MKLVLGLDIGITSVGWGVIDKDTLTVKDYGVRLFEEADSNENVKRRSHRLQRRMISRRKTRREDLNKLLSEHHFYVGELCQTPVLQLRNKGIHEPLTEKELYTVLRFFVKHRGSALEVAGDAESTDDQGTKAALRRNDALISQGKYPCEIQLEQYVKEGWYRGIDNVFRTKDLENELLLILEKSHVDATFSQDILSTIFRRRHFADGPGSFKSQTPYGKVYDDRGNVIQTMIDKMVGHCSIYEDQLRAPRLAPSAELFNFLNDINNVRVNGQRIPVEKKQDIVSVALSKKGLTVKALAKMLEVNEADLTGLRINKNDKKLLTPFDGYKFLSARIYSNGHECNDLKLLDHVAEILNRSQVVDERKEHITQFLDLSDLSTTPEALDELCQSNKMSTTHSLSFKAIYELNDELLASDMNQMEIIYSNPKFIGTHFSYKGLKKIPARDDLIYSPVARRAYREAIKVVNAIRQRYGHLYAIVVETTREWNSAEQKKSITQSQGYFEKINAQCDELVKDFDVHMNGKLREKLRLYLEQHGKTGYTQQPIDLRVLITDPTAYEVDHIIPISISLDDSYSNKILVTHTENQQKGNRTPLMAFRNGCFSSCNEARYVAFCHSLANNDTPNFRVTSAKMRNLLFNLDINRFDVQKQFIARNLVDTSYTVRTVMNNLKGYFKDNEIDTKVFTVKGSLTHAFRMRIGLRKNRDDFGHHGIDALIIASLLNHKLLSKDYDRYELGNDEIYDKDLGDVLDSEIDSNDYFDKMYFGWIKQLVQLPTKHISWKVDRKPNRAFCDQTIYSTRNYGDGDVVIKKYKNIYDPKFYDLANDIYAGKYDKYLMYRHDPQTFDKLIEVVNHYVSVFHGDTKMIDPSAKKPFKFNPFDYYQKEFGMIRKYAKHDDGPVIKTMKYIDGKLGSALDISTHYDVHNKKVVLLQLTKFRTDFFNCDGLWKFVTVPTYIVKFMSANGHYAIDPQWYHAEMKRKGIESVDDFRFSMYRNDYIYIEFAKEGSIPSGLYRFIATNNDNTNRIELNQIHFRSENRFVTTVGRNINDIRKFNHNVTGNLIEIKKEELVLNI